MNQHLQPNLAEHRGEVFSNQDLRALGMTRVEIARCRATGTVRQLRRGWYWVQPNRKARAGEFYRAVVEATVRDARRHSRELVLSGPAAAVWWELPWIGWCPDAVTVCGPTNSGRSSGDAQSHTGLVPPSQIAQHDGVFVTNPARTVIDVARLAQERTALAVADEALRKSMTTREELTEVAGELTGWRGIGSARRVLALADPRAESPGESISRYCMAQANLPMPELQVAITLPNGTIARVDFLWREAGLIGEFDGLIKYKSADPKVLIAEKIREDALRSLGYTVFRWTWKDVWHPSEWLTSLSAALAHPTHRPKPRP